VDTTKKKRKKLGKPVSADVADADGDEGGEDDLVSKIGEPVVAAKAETPKLKKKKRKQSTS